MKLKNINIICGAATVATAVLSVVGSIFGAKKQEAMINDAAAKAVKDLMNKQD